MQLTPEHEQLRDTILRWIRDEVNPHVDQLYDVFPDRLRPIAPCYRAAFEALERWVETRGQHQPPGNQVIPRSGGDLANECALQ